MKVIQRTGVRAKDRDLALKWIKRCLREITRKDYELPVDYGEARNDLVVTVKRAGHRSSACAKGITIDISAYTKGTSALLGTPPSLTIPSSDPETPSLPSWSSPVRSRMKSAILCSIDTAPIHGGYKNAIANLTVRGFEISIEYCDQK